MRRLLGWLPLVHLVPLLAYLSVRPFITRELAANGPGVPARLERLWWSVHNLVSLLNEFTLYLFLPLPLWLLTAAVARTRIGTALAAMPWVLFLALYGQLFVPRPSQLEPAARAQEALSLRVTTFNVLGVDRAPTELIATIRRMDPDVLLVQELSLPLAAALDDALNRRYPHSRTRPTSGGRGAGIWSKHPIVLEEQWDRSRRGDRWQHAVVNVQGQQVHLVNLHLTAPALRWTEVEEIPVPLVTGEVTQGRLNEVDDLVPLLRPLVSGPAPVIVAGDLNMTDQTPEYRRLADVGLRDAHREAGWGFGHTFPSVPAARIFGRRVAVPMPLLRIDHIFVSSRVTVRRVQTGPTSGGSDHLPVTADLRLR